MNEILDTLVYCNLPECKQILKAVQDRIRLLEERERLADSLKRFKSHHK